MRTLYAPLLGQIYERWTVADSMGCRGDLRLEGSPDVLIEFLQSERHAGHHLLQQCEVLFVLKPPASDAQKANTAIVVLSEPNSISAEIRRIRQFATRRLGDILRILKVNVQKVRPTWKSTSARFAW